MPGPVGHRVLVIDDDRLFLEIVQVKLERVGCRVETAPDPRQGLNRAIEEDFDLILLDLVMPELAGEEVLRLLKPLSLRHRIMVVSATSQEDRWPRVRDLGAVAYFQKPVDYDVLCRTVVRVLQEKAQADVRLSASASRCRLLDGLAKWVFDAGDVTPARRLVALGVAGGLLGVLLWLVLW